MVKVVKVHDQLHILVCKLGYIILSEEVIEISCEELSIIIGVQPTKCSIWLKVVAHCKFLPGGFDIELQVGNALEELAHFLLSFDRK